MKTLKPASEKQIYIWNIIGSMLNALLSVLLLMIASLLLSDRETDIFSLGWSFAMQAMTVGTFQVRLYQSTDVEEKYSFNQYLIFRVLTVLAMFIYSAVYLHLSGYHFQKVLIIFLVCVARSADVFSDLFQGWFQQKERLDLAGKAFSAHSASIIIVFVLTVLFSKNLLIACFFMIVGNYLMLFLFDLRYFLIAKQAFGKQATKSTKNFLLKLILDCLPIFINAYIIMEIFNKPRFAIDGAISAGQLPDGSQKIYGVLFLPASALTLVFIVFRPLITQLAIQWNNNNRSGFLRIIKSISLYLLLISVVIVAVGYFLGCPVLSFVYNVELNGFKNVLLIIIVGGLFNTFLYLFDNAITVIRCHSYLIIAYLVTWIYTVFTVDAFVKNHGILGGALCFASSMLLLLICTAIIFFICISKRKPNHNH